MHNVYARSTGASSTGACSTVLTGASSTSATSMCYKPQWYSYSVSTSGTVTVLLALCAMV